ncbi:MAG: pantetheine-phosphate adenylyltransferase [Clostridiales bacterium]|jgi:pantetheine-phosphate adenylyltransferase|nr:pantetheine-phosphate adenylyltransferase [Clostridiales bacterium]
MRIGVFPGSFDPLTSGHYDLIERAAALVDCLYVAVLKNSDKTPLFTLKQRKEMIESATALLPNVKVEAFEGLLVDFARQKGASVLFRGLRNQLDYEQETMLATVNHRLAPEIQTVCLFSKPEWTFLSSSIVKEMLRYGQDIRGLVPAQIYDKIRAELHQ